MPKIINGYHSGAFLGGVQITLEETGRVLRVTVIFH